MVINNVMISEEKLADLINKLPEYALREEYEVSGLSGIEIAKKYGLTERLVCSLRQIYGIATDQKYQLRRNNLRHLPLSEYQNNVLFGSLFGDSCIAVQSSGTGFWFCTHCLKQEEYLLKLAQIFSPFVAKVYYGERPFEKGGKVFPYVRARSFALPQFTEYRKLFYPEGKKELRKELLEKLTPTGFAYWYMDDGSTTGYGFDITTYADYFRTSEAVDIFKDVLNLKVSINWSDDGEGKIHVLKESHDTAYEYIKSEMVNCLSYKYSKKYQNQDNQQPSFDGNIIEGSTTEGSLNSDKEHGDNTYQEKVTSPGMPCVCEEQMMIQSELVGNYEK
jgi:hypothetical protein